MSSIEASFTLGTEISFENLTVFPLLRPSLSDVDYDTLDAALASGALEITEVGDAGSVPEIKVQNRGTRPVLIIDGEELVGAKQNRTVNVSILVPPTSTVVVPVTCVEAGRWSVRSRSFAATPRTHFATGRAAKSSQITASLRREGVARADQSEVWRQIDDTSVRLETRSSTSAMADIYERQSDTIETFVGAVPVAEHQIGAVFLLNGRPAGVDLFDHSKTTASLMPKILRGYALDAIDVRSSQDADRSTTGADLRTRANQFMREVLDAPRTSFDSPGIGVKCRLFAPGITGGALIVDGRLVHMSAFPG